jgi:xylulose-5-phosphate/fructose-6-phosphate phosphoketolase
MLSSDSSFLKWLPSYLRYTDYLGAAMLYLKDNVFLEKPLAIQHMKPRILGHWGTVPGLNFIYANLNYLVCKHKCEMLLVTGPGHGAPAILANLFAEGTIREFYKNYTQDAKGTAKLLRDFSWPHSPFPSHVTPGVPGSILEGGELGYSLATAYGAVLDNPHLIAAVVVGDGEAESGPIAAAWHANKFLNPKTSGAVLPIVHINGYKISNPTIFGRMGDEELWSLFRGYGYEPLIVEGRGEDAKGVEKVMVKAMEKAYQKIRKIQTAARNGKQVLKPQWPVILLRTPKGWRGLDVYHGHAVKGSFHSHGIPVESKDAESVAAVEKWLRSYKVQELVDDQGRPKPELLRFVPKSKWRIGMSPQAVGGNLLEDLKFPKLKNYSAVVEEPGKIEGSSMEQAGKFLRDLFRNNPKNFRFFCPDEAESNKLGAMFQATKRSFQWPIFPNDEFMAPEGRIIEMLSEHTLQGMSMGYILTGRHSLFASYEAFTTIISSMVDQYAKFLKQSFNVKWRKPVASMVFLQTSVGWRQEHNGYSHQNPSFVSSVLQKHGEFCQIYYPADVNSTLVAFEDALSKKNAICVIVADKRYIPQWLTLDQAREQAKRGLAIWEWASSPEQAKNPDVVLASAGDYMTQEALYAIQLCRDLVPEIKIRYVNVSELTALCLGDSCNHMNGTCLTRAGLEFYFTKDKPVVFNYHGYVNDMEHILWPFVDSKRFSLHGYLEHGSTTTPFDMKVANKVSCYDLAMDMIEQVSKTNPALARKRKKLIQTLQDRIDAHQKYIRQFGDDPQEVKEMNWRATAALTMSSAVDPRDTSATGKAKP